MLICPSGSEIINAESCFLFPREINISNSGSQIYFINTPSITKCLASTNVWPLGVFVLFEFDRKHISMLCCLFNDINIFIQALLDKT